MLRQLALFVACFLFSFAFAHPANVASSQIKVLADGSFVATIRFDLAAFATDATPKDASDAAMHAFLDSNDEAMERALNEAESRFRSGFASEPAGSIDQLEFPSVADVRQYLASDPKPRIPMMMVVTIRGHLPKEARTVAFRYAAMLDTVIQTVEIPYTEPLSEPVEAGRASSTIGIPSRAEIARLKAAIDAPRTVPVRSEPKVVTAPKPVKPLKTLMAVPKPMVDVPTTIEEPTRGVAQVTRSAPPKNPVEAVVKPASTEIELPRSEPPAPSSTVGTYLKTGFTHILPEGIDHILFVLGLFLLGSKAKALLKQVTAFTVAHSITLALATLNIVRLPGRVIEPLIAASIAFVAIENLFLKDVRPWRTAVVFLFGLVHGLGFAEVFANAGLRGRGLVEALLSFNVGVELGQLSVIALAFTAVGWFRQNPLYRQRIVVPASVAIAALALFWTVERTIG